MLDDSSAARDLNYVTKEAMKFIKIVFLHYGDQVNHKRLYLAIRAIHALYLNLHQEHKLSKQIITNLRIYFNGTGDAYLSTFEVRSVLYASFMLTNKFNLFDTYCQEFDKIMPECSAEAKPGRLPNLSQLARSQIWRNLSASNLPLPLAIEKLVLPKRIKNFLSGKVFDISRNGSSEKAVIQSEPALLLFEQSIF